MKKYLALLLAACVLVLSSACTTDNPQPGGTATTTTGIAAGTTAATTAQAEKQSVLKTPLEDLFLAEENAGYDYTSDSPQADTTAKAQTQTKTQTQAVSKTSATGSPAVTETDADPQSKIVYITDTGKKYHRDGCQYLRESRHAISLEDAQNEGYSPCKKCFRT